MEKEMPKRLKKHIVICPHCGAQALDHMTECPKCKGELTPRGYTPALSEATVKRVRLILWIVLSAIVILYLIYKFSA